MQGPLGARARALRDRHASLERTESTCRQHPKEGTRTDAVISYPLLRYDKYVDMLKVTDGL